MIAWYRRADPIALGLATLLLELAGLLPIVWMDPIADPDDMVATMSPVLALYAAANIVVAHQAYRVATRRPRHDVFAGPLSVGLAITLNNMLLSLSLRSLVA